MEQISVNLIPSGIKGTCHASQFDIGRNIRFALLSGSNIYTLSGTETITLKIRKPDGTEKTETLANTSSTYVDLVTSRDTCDQSGTYDCEITVTDGGVVIGSGNFTMEVEADSLDGIIVVKTASGEIASFETSLPFPLQEAKFTLPYRAEGYTELTHYKATSTPVKDNAPYRLRKAPSGIGNKSIEKLIGASVNFNQLADYSNARSTFTKDGITVTNNNDGSYTINGTANADIEAYLFNTLLPFEKDHVYYSRFCISGGSDSTYRVYLFANNGNNLIDKDFGNGNIIKAGTYTNQNMSPYIEVSNGTEINNLTVYYQFIDLTAFFGSSAIADHLYNLEQATAGAGVAKFKALGFDAPYYPYTAGQLMSSAPVAKKIIGKNLFGGEPEDLYRLKLPKGTTLTASSDALTEGTPFVRYFDENKILIDYWGLSDVSGSRRKRTFTLQEDIFYIQFTTSGTSSETIENMQLEFGSSATTYEPYKEEMTIYSGEELRGIFELDANNNIVANGDIDDGSGTGAVIFAEENTDNVTFLYNGDNNWLSGELPNCDTNIDWVPEAISDLPYTLVNSNVLSSNDKSWTLYGGKLFIRDTTKTENELRSIIENKKIVYHRATPTTKSVRTWDNPQPAMAGGTEEFIDGNVYGAVDLGSLEWVYTDATGHERMKATLSEWKRPANNGTVANGFCEGIEIITANAAYSHGAEGLAKESDTNNIYFYSSDMGTDAATFKAAMSGHWLIYEKAAEGPAEMPCGHDTTYADNLKYSKKTFAQIYGGDLDAVTGDLTSKYNSDGSQKTTPEIIQLTPEAIIALLGTNTVWNDAGETEVKYVDLKGEGT